MKIYPRYIFIKFIIVNDKDKLTGYTLDCDRMDLLLSFVYETLIDTLLRNVRRSVVQFSGLKAGDKVLDVCCGTGAQAIACGMQGIIVSGIDSSRSMLKIAERKKKQEKISNISFQLADAANLPFVDNYFDCGLVSFGLHDKEKSIRQRLITEMLRTVKKGGTLVFLDFQVPLPGNMWGLIAKTVEFLVGGAHYRSFKEYTESRGLENLLNSYGFSEINEINFLSGLITAIKVVNEKYSLR